MKKLYAFFVACFIAGCVVLASLATYSCMGPHPKADNPVNDAQDVSYPLDSAALRRAQLNLLPPYVPKPTLVQRVLGITPKPLTPVTIYATLTSRSSIKVGRRSQVNIIQTNGNNNHTEADTRQSSIDKAKGAPVQQATDASVQDAAMLKGNGQLQAVKGDNNKLDAKLEQAKETHWYDSLLTPAGYTIAIVIGLASVATGIWFFFFRKKKQVIENVVNTLV